MSDSISREPGLRHSGFWSSVAFVFILISGVLGFREGILHIHADQREHGGSSNNQGRVPQGKVEKMGSEKLMSWPPHPRQGHPDGKSLS